MAYVVVVPGSGRNSRSSGGSGSSRRARAAPATTTCDAARVAAVSPGRDARCRSVAAVSEGSGQFVRAPRVGAARMMADIGKGSPNIGGGKFEQDTSRGNVITIQKPEVKKKSERKSETEKEKNWRVLLHNDDVHTFDYVTGIIVQVVRTVSRRKAHRITMTAHSHGIATVTTTWKAMAEEYCKGLQRQGLTSSIAPDSSFS
ncbi:ATP-dependent Clp protease adapter protein ClpS [Porphyridium purpureum]|uniref:ATP-dependent Clp protease adapter protein ClpS n=1 Tax=Porphyridium purpureum TaxID=35688 RepID=A0A5J4Z744_PORPP|nr:ATP-dependent Clp protease adapter protein ClpS [Porphyridium purpureum]|eukprot:POR1142..scf295_1